MSDAVNSIAGGTITGGSVTITTTGSTNWNYCPECGKKIEAGWKYCPGCGRQIGSFAAPWQYVPMPHYPSPVTPYYPNPVYPTIVW